MAQANTPCERVLGTLLVFRVYIPPQITRFSVVNWRAFSKKVTSPWTGASVRTAGGHAVTPLRLCAARVEIREATFLTTCLVLSECTRDINLGIEFYGNMTPSLTSASSASDFWQRGQQEQTDAIGLRSALRVSDHRITIPPCKSDGSDQARRAMRQ